MRRAVLLLPQSACHRPAALQTHAHGTRLMHDTTADTADRPAAAGSHPYLRQISLRPRRLASDS